MDTTRRHGGWWVNCSEEISNDVCVTLALSEELWLQMVSAIKLDLEQKLLQS